MCPVRKQSVNSFIRILTAGLTLAAPALAGGASGGLASAKPEIRSGPAGSAGGVAVGEGAGGITDRAYITAPPNYLYVVEKARGSFLDCGEGQEARATDADGRDRAHLRCGVTLTETIVIPAAASSARFIVHY